jgi:L-seryl-tRNA(Ser) seleniumtransferase
LAIRPRAQRGAGRALERLAAAFRRLPVPVIGRIERDAQILDLRCIEDEAAFAANFAALDL